MLVLRIENWSMLVIVYLILQYMMIINLIKIIIKTIHLYTLLRIRFCKKKILRIDERLTVVVKSVELFVKTCFQLMAVYFVNERS